MNTTETRRLAFIKYLFELGVAQSHLPEPANSVGVLLFHDSVELFLQLACEHLDVFAQENTQFLKYWDLIAEKRSKTLPQKESMKRLNKSRVDLKHHGILPSKLDIETFRGVTNSFFAESTPLVFKLEFQKISLIDFVAEENARQHLHDAQVSLATGELEVALDNTAIAFEVLVDDYEARKYREYGNSPFIFGQDFTFLNKHSMGLGWQTIQAFRGNEDFQRQLGEFVDRVIESLETMQDAIRILAIGIHYSKYSKFKLFAPYVTKRGRGEYQITSRKSKRNPITREDVQFCIDFVIETAFQLQEFDYTLRTS